MGAFLLFIVLITVFVVLMLLWFALSSCLGDEIRAAWSRGQRQQERALPTTYGLQYAQLFGSAERYGLSEQIEMDTILNAHDRDFHDD
jgi:hypothetical protein